MFAKKVRNWKDVPYYTKRFYSALNLCAKDHSVMDYQNTRYRVIFVVNGTPVTYKVTERVKFAVQHLLEKAYNENVSYNSKIIVY